MLYAILHSFRLVFLSLGGHRQVALENLALRQPLAILRRSGTRPRLRERDRQFWVWLARVWTGWRAALVTFILYNTPVYPGALYVTR